MKIRRTFPIKKFKITLLLAILSVITMSADQSQPSNYWKINPGGKSITWQVTPGQSHYDHIEMSGKKVSTVLRYGVDATGALSLRRSVVWPMLRTIPNDTHASLTREFRRDPLADMKINNYSAQNKVTSVTFDGTLNIEETAEIWTTDKVAIRRTLFPSTSHPVLIEICEITNISDHELNLELPEIKEIYRTDPSRGVDGSYSVAVTTTGGGYYKVAPGKTVNLIQTITAYKNGETAVTPDAYQELAKREQLSDRLTGNLILETPDSVLNCMFALSKIRACESIFETKRGPMHGPGGESFYAAIWANDQAEYANPYFPFIGYDYADASAVNCYRLFADYMNDQWKPIPSSVIAEGDSFWNGAGDRGDAAMIAYGASRFVLAKGDRKVAGELWPLIQWCLEYCRRNLNAEGVVCSDSDELEGRFPSGKANLCTSTLYYDALRSASMLAREMGKGSSVEKDYSRQADTLRKNIDRYFARDIEGFDSYAYYEGNDVLRAWICIPLTAGIDERASGTLSALFSPRLWTENGLLTQAGSSTFWDRATLYALRGAYYIGETKRTTDFLKFYSAKRLLGEHVPYAVEAWPEGNQRHLSAESSLYGRIFTEGMFGIRPVGFRKFNLTPRLPEGWSEMKLRNVRAFGSDFDIHVANAGNDKIHVTVTEQGRKVLDKHIRKGDTIKCKLNASAI